MRGKRDNENNQGVAKRENVASVSYSRATFELRPNPIMIPPIAGENLSV